MADFVNTIDVLGDDAVIDSIIERTITEFKDDTVTTVGKRAFCNCTSLTTVDLPNVTRIKESAFEDCSSLHTINTPMVTGIGAKSFKNCTSIEEADFPLVTDCGTSAGGGFQNCTNLKRINFPLLKKVVGDFGGTALTRVMLPSATSISGFSTCNALVLCDFPVAEEIMGSAFYGSKSLTALILRNTSKMCTFGGGNAFLQTPIKNGTGYIYVPRKFLSDTDATMDYRQATNWSVLSEQFRAIEDFSVDGTVTGELDETKI